MRTVPDVPGAQRATAGMSAKFTAAMASAHRDGRIVDLFD
jgi:hypothetical protein